MSGDAQIAYFRGGLDARRGAGFKGPSSVAYLCAVMNDDVCLNTVRSQHRKRWRRRDYQRRKQRDGCADVAIMMTQAVVVGVGGISTAVVGVDRCLELDGFCKVLGVNVPKGQGELDRKRRQRQPASEPQSGANPSHEYRHRSGQIGPDDEDNNIVQRECPLGANTRGAFPPFPCVAVAACARTVDGLRAATRNHTATREL